MASGAPDSYERRLDDYIDVAERMAEFYERYPEGSLRAADPAHPWEMAIVTGNKKDGTPTTQTFIVYSALAYRHPADPAPGVGVAWEIFPGRTPYTLGSELMNAETSAWGRAMAALGIATKRGIASRQEVQARRDERDQAAEHEARGQWQAPVETRADGSATDAELERMNRGPVPGLERFQPTMPERTEWDAEPPTQPDPRTSALRGMFALYRELEVDDKDDMLADINAILGRPTGYLVMSRADLSLEEITAVNGVLRKRRDAKRAAESVAARP